MKPRFSYEVFGALMLIIGAIVFSRGAGNGPAGPSTSWDDIIKQNAAQRDGKSFRFAEAGCIDCWCY